MPLALACWDLGLAVDLAGQAGVPAELSALVEQVYRRARAQYGDAGGEMLLIKLYEDLTGTPLRLPTHPTRDRGQKASFCLGPAPSGQAQADPASCQAQHRSGPVRGREPLLSRWDILRG